jgi:hypothetical protein
VQACLGCGIITAKKIYPMKLVSVHTHLLLLFMFTLFGQVSVAQESWTLQQCTDTALVYNRTLQMERNNRSIAEEQYREAKANLIPKLQAQAEYRYFMELPYQLMPMSVFSGGHHIHPHQSVGRIYTNAMDGLTHWKEGGSATHQHLQPLLAVVRKAARPFHRMVWKSTGMGASTQIGVRRSGAGAFRTHRSHDEAGRYR